MRPARAARARAGFLVRTTACSPSSVHLARMRHSRIGAFDETPTVTSKTDGRIFFSSLLLLTFFLATFFLAAFFLATFFLVAFFFLATFLSSHFLPTFLSSFLLRTFFLAIEWLLASHNRNEPTTSLGCTVLNDRRFHAAMMCKHTACMSA